MKKKNKFLLVKDVMYFHGKTIDGYRFTIAGYISEYEQGENELKNRLHMGISICGDRDMFCKSTGRGIATTRLLSINNTEGLGQHLIDILDLIEIENEFKYFTIMAAKYNNLSKKVLLKFFNLYRHKDELPF